MMIAKNFSFCTLACQRPLLLGQALRRNSQSHKSLSTARWQIVLFALVIVYSVAGSQVLLAQETPSPPSLELDAPLAVTPTATDQGANTPVVATEPIVTLGLTNDPLQRQVGDLLEAMLVDQGYHVVRKVYTDLPALLTALDRADISLGLARPVDALVLHYHLPLTALPTDMERLLQLVDSMAQKKDVTWLTPMLVSEDYALFEVANSGGSQSSLASGRDIVVTLPQMAKQMQSNAKQFNLCLAAADQPLWSAIEPVLVESYTLPVTQLVQQIVESPLTAETLTNGRCDLLFAPAQSTLPTESAAVLSVVTDPDHFFPPNHPSLVVQQSLLEQFPALPDLWATLSATMNEAALAELQNAYTAALAATGESNAAAGDSEHVLAEVTPQERVAYHFLLNHTILHLPTITVGSRDETAQDLLGEIIVQLLMAAGYPVVDQVGALNVVDVVDVVETTDNSIAVALVGEMLTLHDGVPLAKLPRDLVEALTILRDTDQAQNFTILQPLDFSLARVLLVDKDLAGLGITTLSRLAAYTNRFDAPFTICIDSEFYSHPITGLGELEEFYGFHFDPAKILLMDEDTIFTAIQERQCQVTVGTITDGRVVAWNLLPLLDDDGFFPPNHPLTIINNRLLTSQPQLVTLLGTFVPFLDTATMQQLTALVELGADGQSGSGDEMSPADVARAFLAEHNLPVQNEGAEEGVAHDESGVVVVKELAAEQLNAFEELPDLPSTARVGE